MSPHHDPHQEQPQQPRTIRYSLFALLAAPLIFSADIRGNGSDPAAKNNWTPELNAILLNRDIIAVSQDPLGVQGALAKQLSASPFVQLCVCRKSLLSCVCMCVCARARVCVCVAFT